MKKLLALVLALVMSMSLVTISNAADFSDAKDIDYTEAVDVLAAVGVLEGSDGKFDPKAELTREQAAKIIAYLDLGKDVAEALPAVKVFNDVEATRWSAKFVAYCADAGYIAGVGNGNFDPTGKLTGYAFGKMLLCALGYDAAIEEFTGSAWTIKVAKLMESNSLTKGTSKLGSAVLTREEAAQYALNALMATMVEYDTKGTNITIGGDATVTVGASKASAVAQTGYSDAGFGANLQLAEKLYNADGRKFSVEYDYSQGNQSRQFSYKGDTVTGWNSCGTVLATSVNGTALADLTDKSSKDYIGYKANDTVSYFINDNNSNAGAVATAAAKKGVIVNFIDTDDDGKYDAICVLEKTAYQVTGDIRTSTSGKVTKVTIPGVITSKDVNDIVYPTDLVEDDYVLMYVSGDGTTYVEKAQTVTGTITSTSASKVYVDGTKYSVSGLTGAKAISVYGAEASKADTIFYLDNGGNIIDYKLTNDAVKLDTTLFVRDAVASGYTYQAKVVYMDGSTATITVAKTSTYNGTMKDVSGIESTMADGKIKANTFYTFYKNDNGSYNLKACQYQTYSSTTANATVDTIVAKGVATIAGKYANGTTAYILEKGKLETTTPATFTAGTSYSLYTGVSNTASYTDSDKNVTGVTPAAYAAATAYVLYNSSNKALAVVGRNGLIDNTTASDYTVVMAISGPVTVYKTDGSVDYYTWEAIVNGEYVEAYKTASNSLLTLGAFALVNGFDGDKANSVESTPVGMTPASVGDGTTVKVDAGTLSLSKADGTVVGAYALANDAKVIVYNVADKEAEVIDPANLYAADGHFYSVSTVAKSNTDAAVKYVLVNDTRVAAPTFSASSVSVTAGSAATVTVTPPGGSTATVTPGNAAVATASLTGSTLTVNGLAAGSTTVTVAVTNAAGVVTNYTIAVTVTAAP